MIEVKSISKAYPSPSGGRALKVLSDINFSIQAGESVSIMGPSGSGKSTLLNLIGTMDKPSHGQILFYKKDVTQLGEVEASQFRAREIGFVFQDHRLLPQCTLIENVLLPTLSLHKKAPDESVARAKQLIEKVGLSDRIHHFPSECSGGECQRIAVVRALINQPKLILADEPTGALDYDNAHALIKYLCHLSESEKCTVVIVTHDRDMLSYTKNNLELKSGQLV